ncbi:MAG: ATP-binding protein [Salibacteraceae bacterium]
MKSFWLAFLISTPIVGFSQTPSDSLLALFDKSSSWNEKAELTYEFCKLNLGANPDKCLEMYLTVEKNIQSVTDSNQLFNLYNVTGVIYQFRHNNDTSNLYLLQAFEIAKGLNDSMLINKSITNIAINYRNEGNYQKSIEYSLVSLAYYKSIGDTLHCASSLTDLGNSFIYLRNYTDGMAYQKQALVLFKAKNNWNGIGNTYGSMAYIFSNQNNLDSAIYFTNLAISAHEKSGNLFSLVSAKRSLCTYYYRQGKSDQEVYDCHAEVLQLSTQLKDKQGMMMDYLNLSQSLSNLARYEEAIPLNLKALKLSKKLDDNRVRLECYKSLAIKMYNTKRYKLAYSYSDSALILEQELNSIDVQNAALEADRKFQIAEKEKELLQTKNEKATSDLLLLKKEKQLWSVAGLVGLVLLISGFILYRTKQRQKSNLAKARIEEQQKGLAAIIQAQEDERKRIAKDLHDGIVQQLGGLKLGFQKVFSENATPETDKIVKILDDSAQELRELSHKMMPRALGELGLIPALEDMLENSLGNSQIDFNFEHFGLTKRLQENIEIAIYRIAQELVNNVIKHSKANKVNMQLLKSGVNVILILEDNGTGMANSNSQNGIGLMNIASRLDTLNGKVNFEPSPGSGTLATVKIPINTV